MVVLQKSVPNQLNISDIIQFVNENMYWFHCNGCYFQPDSNNGPKFYITNCSHIFCMNCVGPATKEGCKICKTQCTVLELNGKMKKEVENLFSEPSAILQKAMKQVNQVVEFQKSHSRRWSRHWKEIAMKSTRDLKKMVEHMQSVEKQFIEMKKENQYLKLLLSKNDPGSRSNKHSPGLSKGPTFGGNGLANRPSSRGPSPNTSFYGNTVNSGGNRSTGGRSPNTSYFGSNQGFSPQNQIRNMKPAATTNVMNQPNRILMTTPPSGGHLGTTRSRHSYISNGTAESMASSMITPPLSVPRPLPMSQDDC